MTAVSTLVGTGFGGFFFGSMLTWYLRRHIERVVVVLKHAKNPDKLQTKMALVVRTDVNMKPGKVASQCAHAAVNCYKASSLQNAELTRIWEGTGQPKIVLRCTGETSFYTLENQATERKLIHSLITDAGRTALTPGTKTVLGIGPGPADDVDAVTGKLKLY